MLEIGIQKGIFKIWDNNENGIQREKSMVYCLNEGMGRETGWF